MTAQIVPTPKFRIANFSNAAISHPYLISVGAIGKTEAVTTLREYADLPYIYVVSADKKEFVIDILADLKNIRSTCVPRCLIVIDGDYSNEKSDGIDLIDNQTEDPDKIVQAAEKYAREKFIFDKSKLNNMNANPMPLETDVLIIGGGITGLYAAKRLADAGITFCIVEEKEIAGGIWSTYANATSQVNTSEGAYRVLESDTRNNRDHSSTAEILEDLYELSQAVSDSLFTGAKAVSLKKIDGRYMTVISRNGTESEIISKGAIIAVNDRVGTLRLPTWENQERYTGTIVSGTSDESLGLDWTGKRVAVVGMGAFAVENVRTALENGASHVSVICRRHGTVCPKIIDYLNFSTPYDENFEHDRKSNIRNMMLWKKLYDLSGATQPECWMGKIKHRGHTISVSDIWFIAHHLKKLDTITGSITEMYDHGVVVNHDHRIEADIVVNCIGFHRNASSVKELCRYDLSYNNNYLDKDLMYLADAYIDDDVFNSFFGSSVLEMTKFYMTVYLHFFDNPEFDTMINSEGIATLPIEERSWSHYIAGADSLMKNYPLFYEAAKEQIEQRTANFHESHDLETYIAQNRREWFETHRLLGGQEIPESQYLPYVFGKLIEKKVV